MFIKYKKNTLSIIYMFIKDKSQYLLSLTGPSMAVSIMNCALIFFFTCYTDYIY